MSADRHTRLKDLLSRALDLPRDGREAYLRRACAEDPEMLVEALELLAHDRPDAEQVPLKGIPRPEDLIGTTVGRFRIIGLLGEGGMGTVFLAEQTGSIRRRVALKVIKLGLDTREVVTRFESERQTLAQMNHATIAKVHDAGATGDGRPYFVMEYIEGEPIHRYCERRMLSIDQRLDLFIRICEGVQHAHQKGIIHRDIKPENILVTEIDGEATPKIIDFGVARAIEQPLDGLTRVTLWGEHIGTLGYMSPEQAGLMAVDIDTRTDVYSLGALLNTLLAGGHPFAQTDLGSLGYEGALRMIQEEDPPPPSKQMQSVESRSSDISRVRGDLDWITLKALEKDRDRRYASPSELVADLRRHLENQPVLAGPPSAFYRARKFVRRNRWAVMAIGMVLLALVAGIIGASAGLIQARRAERVAMDQWQRAEAGKFYRMAQMEEISPQAFALSLKAVELSDQPEFRRQVKRLAHQGPQLFRLPLVPGSHNPFTVDFSPDGQWLTVGWSVSGSLQLFSRNGGEPRLLDAHRGRISRAKFSADSRYLVTVSSDSLICLWMPHEAKLLRSWKTQGPAWPFFHPTEERLIVCEADFGVAMRWYFLPLEGGERTEIGRTGPQPGEHFFDMALPDIDPTGRWMVQPDGGHVDLYSMGDLSAGPVRRLGSHSAKVNSAFFSPDGERVASFDSDGDVRIWAVNGDQDRFLRRMQANSSPVFARFDPTGNYLSVSGNPHLNIWDLRQTEKAKPMELSCSNWMFDAAFDPLGEWIVTIGTGAIAGAWSLVHEYPITLQTDQEGLLWVLFSPDGKWLITSGDQGMVDAWPLDGKVVGDPVRLFHEKELSFWRPCFDDSGRYLFMAVCNSSMGNGTLLRITMEDGELRRWGGSSCGISTDATGRYVVIAADASISRPVPRILDTRTDQFLSLDDPGIESFQVFGFVEDGRVLGKSGQGLTLWDPQTRDRQDLGFDMYMVWISADRRTVIGASRDGSLFRCPLDSPEPEPISMKLDSINPYGAALDASGKIMASGKQNGEVEILNLEKGSHHRLPLHDSFVISTAIDPLGRWVATAAGGVVRLVPIPDGSPSQDLSRADFLRKFQALTSLQVVEEEGAEEGYSVQGRSVPEWNNPPRW